MNIYYHQFTKESTMAEAAPPKKANNKGKELAQCLAFAYFAKNPNSAEEGHAEGFYTLFSGKSVVSTYRDAKLISSNFPIEKVKKEFKITKTKTNKTSYHVTAKKVYNVAKACIESRMFKYPLDQYEFLDQDDDFVKLIKDETIKKFKEAFGYRGMKVDMFSSIDMFAVKFSEKRKIEQDFKLYFNNSATILEDKIWGKSGANDYAGLIGKYMKAGTLIPLSLKLPNAITVVPKVKLISFDKSINANAEIDPYIKMLTAILAEPEKTEDIIDTVIDIDFDKFVLHETLNWQFPVNFNYKKLIDPTTKEPIADHNLRFNLFAQGYGAGWNGQFDKSTKMFKETQWVGGASIPAFERIAKDYPQYKTSENKMVKLRVSIFKKNCEVLAKKNPVAYDKVKGLKTAAETTLESPNILYGAKLLKKVIDFFNAYDKESKNKKQTSFLDYCVAFIDEVRKFNKQYKRVTDKDIKRIKGHFAHAQLSYFMIDGGKSFELYFKQRMFLTIYGLITKMAHKVFDLKDYRGMKNAITTVIRDEAGKEIIQEFRTAPHYLIS